MLLGEPLLAELGKELRRQTGHNAEIADLATLLRSSVIRPDLIS